MKKKLILICVVGLLFIILILSAFNTKKVANTSAITKNLTASTTNVITQRLKAGDLSIDFNYDGKSTIHNSTFGIKTFYKDEAFKILATGTTELIGAEGAVMGGNNDYAYFFIQSSDLPGINESLYSFNLSSHEISLLAEGISSPSFNSNFIIAGFQKDDKYVVINLISGDKKNYALPPTGKHNYQYWTISPKGTKAASMVMVNDVINKKDPSDYAFADGVPVAVYILDLQTEKYTLKYKTLFQDAAIGKEDGNALPWKDENNLQFAY
ncbi:MAG TPA: hypothetical protein VMC41_02945 [Candidatus Nanoarchaeia archaeon]|nr:hypothetical protein [Candidatus Nanoarchaeia archaeon]